MRIGQNPARMGIEAYQPAEVGLAILVYIPHQTGYFEEALQILEMELDSLAASTARPLDVCIFDNGSCEAVKQTLLDWQAQGRIDWLLSSSHNMGKAGALNWMFGAMPNDLIAYADSDIFFRPGWLEESLKILQAFPMAGMIGAQPCFFDVLKGTGTALNKIDDSYERFDYSPSLELITEYAHSLGYGEEMIQRYSSAPLLALRARASGVEAIPYASHMQFLIRREVARAILPLTSTQGLKPQETQLVDRRVDEAGFMHLSTLQSLVLHMGNVYDASLRAELDGTPRPQPGAPAKQAQPRKTFIARLARNPRLRPLFYRLYKALFEIYSA